MPTPPPRDENGNIVPHDHLEILNADGIIRRVSLQQVVEDPKAVGGRKLSSIVLNPASADGGLSVDLKRPIEEDGIDPRAYVISTRWVGSVILAAQTFRDETLMVGYHPLPQNIYHGEVWGNFSNARKKKLLRVAAWFVPIHGVTLC